MARTDVQSDRVARSGQLLRGTQPRASRYSSRVSRALRGCAYLHTDIHGACAQRVCGFASQGANHDHGFFRSGLEQLRRDPGESVTLNYLDIGSYPSANGIGPSRPYDVRVYDTNWNSVFSTTGSLTSTQRINFATTSTTGLYLQWGPSQAPRVAHPLRGPLLEIETSGHTGRAFPVGVRSHVHEISANCPHEIPKSHNIRYRRQVQRPKVFSM